MGSSSKQTVGYWYYMGLHFAVCYGPVDSLLRILIGDRLAWSGTVTGNETIEIDAGDLFGGKKREGGVEGDLDVMMGAADQVANDYLSDQIEGLMPAFRGVLSLVFKGGRIAANNPYVKPWAFMVRRITSSWFGGSAWYPEKASIEGIGEGEASVFREYFDSCNLDQYGLIQGDTTDPFSIIEIDDNCAIQTSTGEGHNVIGRELGRIGKVFKIRAKVRLISIDSDDAGSFSLRDEDNNIVFDLNACRESAIDSLRRPVVGFFDQSGLLQTPIGSGALTTNRWYQFESEFDQDSNEFACTLTDLTDMSVFGTANVSVTDRPAAKLLCFTNDDFNGAGTAAFDEIEIYIDDPLVGMNPAHIVYQSLTDPTWGLGYPVAQIDEDSFEAAADTLFDEGLGLCMIWNQQSSIEDFVQQVLDHMGGLYYADPKTGKFKLKLLRNDYDPETLTIYDESSIISIDKFERPGYGETVNEITVVFDDFSIGKESAITVQDLANIQAQGAVVSQTRQYPGLPTSTLAARIGERDLIAASTPLAKCQITVNRSAWEEAPGEVIKVSWDKLGLNEVIFRVLTINYGTLDNGRLVIDLAEDVYGLPASSYSVQEPGGFVPPNTSPSPANIQDVLETPYWDIARGISAADLSFLDPTSGFVMAVASTTNGLNLGFDIYTRISPAEYATNDVSGTFSPSALTTAALGRSDTIVPFGSSIRTSSVSVGDRVLVGTGAAAEFMEVIGFDSDGNLEVNRGILDTTPQEHASGARLFFNQSDFGVDTTERSLGDVVDVKLSVFSTGGELGIATATAMQIEMAQRFYRPYPPGKIRLNGENFPATVENDVTVTWAHRDRLQQLVSYVSQDENSIGPEAGTIYNVYYYLEDVLVHSDIAVSGTTSNYVYELGGDGRIEIESQRDSDVVSWQRQIREFVIEVTTDPLASDVISLCHFPGSDGSTTITDVTGRVWAVNGNAQIDTGQSKFGGTSLQLDGTGDYLRADQIARALVGVSDWTIEAWVYSTSSGSSESIFAFNGAPGAGNENLIILTATLLNVNGTTHSLSPALPSGQWNHVALVREGSGNEHRVYINGTQVLSHSESAPITINTRFSLGQEFDGSTASDFLNGWIDDFRVTKNVARYSGTFTPPTLAFSDDDVGAVLYIPAALLHFNGADASTTMTDQNGRTWTANGNAQLDTAQQKFGSASLLLDGTGDYISTADADDLSADRDFTFECWIRPNFTSTLKCIASKRPAVSSSEWAIYVTAANKLNVIAWGTAAAVTINIVGTTNVQNGVWQHVLFAKRQSTWYLFLGGVLEGSASESASYLVNSEPLMIGRDVTNTARDWNGHIDEARILNGVGLYTSGFTPPSSEYVYP